jgi:hypothetical protein
MIFCQLSKCFAGLISVAAFGFVTGVAQAEQEVWKTCSTPKTQYVLQIPGSLVRSSDPGVTGCTYQSPDGEFTVEAVEQPSGGGPDQSVDARMQKEISVMGGTVAEQEKGANWFALSGMTRDGTEFYRIHFTNGALWVSLRITYPHAKAKKYDKWLSKIEKSFVPFAKQERTEGTER